MQNSLILVRHGHRDTDQGRGADHGLSKKGQAQAKRVAKHFHAVFGKRKALILSSPKRRCVETVFPVARMIRCQVRASSLLDEGGALEKKVRRFLKWWFKEAPELTVLCSHGDWIPECTKALLGTEIHLDKGGWIEIQNKGNGEGSELELRTVLQIL